jgi:hypothetical protein
MDKITVKNKFKGNPRKITDKQMQLLKEHLEELGALSGIIYCVNNKAYVGGNQRSTIFDGADIEIIERFEIPTENKTLAHGFVVYNNEKFAYREVAFTEMEFKKACVVANNDGGSFDFEILKEWDVPFEDWGVEIEEFETDINMNDIETTDEFSLKDGDKAPFQQMTFTLADGQAEIIKNAISEIKQTEEYKYCETFGNENSNGNALYLIVQQWAEQKK